MEESKVTYVFFNIGSTKVTVNTPEPISNEGIPSIIVIFTFSFTYISCASSRITVAVPLAGMLTSRLTFLPSPSHLLLISPYGDRCEASAKLRPPPILGRMMECLKAGCSSSIKN